MKINGILSFLIEFDIILNKSSNYPIFFLFVIFILFVLLSSHIYEDILIIIIIRSIINMDGKMFKKLLLSFLGTLPVVSFYYVTRIGIQKKKRNHLSNFSTFRYQ